MAGKVKTGAFVGGRLNLSVAGAANVTLSQAQSESDIFEFTGLLTGAISVIIPFEDAQLFKVVNKTTGNFVLTVIGSSGLGIVVPGNGTNRSALCYWDGTDCKVMFVELGGPEALAADSANTPAAAAWINGVIRQVPTAARTLTTDTAANFDIALPHFDPGDKFDTIVHNNSAGANAITIAFGVGVTPFPAVPGTIAQNKTMLIRFLKTAAGAYSAYCLVGA